MPIFWWIHRSQHVRFILRELTSIFVALYVCVLMYQIHIVTEGPEAYERFLGWLATGTSKVFHSIVFVFVLFHSITWFNLSPKALALSFRGRRLPDAFILAFNYAGWAAVSGVIAWAVLE